MDWFRVVDNYCERIDAGYWSEPVNALTNGAFLVAAVVAWRIAARRGDRGGRLLAALVFAIGVGSYLFHTHAQVWSMLADVLPIQAFILVYLYLATVRFFALPWWGGILAVAAFIPYSILVARGPPMRRSKSTQIACSVVIWPCWVTPAAANPARSPV